MQIFLIFAPFSDKKYFHKKRTQNLSWELSGGECAIVRFNPRLILNLYQVSSDQWALRFLFNIKSAYSRVNAAF